MKKPFGTMFVTLTDIGLSKVFRLKTNRDLKNVFQFIEKAIYTGDNFECLFIDGVIPIPTNEPGKKKARKK